MRARLPQVGDKWILNSVPHRLNGRGKKMAKNRVLFLFCDKIPATVDSIKNGEGIIAHGLYSRFRASSQLLAWICLQKLRLFPSLAFLLFGVEISQISTCLQVPSRFETAE
jgi:hypothetical protein